MPLTLAVACANAMVNVNIYVSLWLVEMLSFNPTSLTQNRTQKERLQTVAGSGIVGTDPLICWGGGHSLGHHTVIFILMS